MSTRLSRLEIRDFHSIAHASIDFDAFTLISGANWAGKTSIQQAIRMCLTGDVSRVKLKGAYQLLVRDTAKSATIVGTWNDEKRTAVLKRAASGHQVPLDAVIHPALLDMERFCRAGDDEARIKLAMEILSGPPDVKQVSKDMVERGVASEDADYLAPFLATGFDVALKAAEDQKKEARAAWCAVTGEARYGDDKAAEWVPPSGSTPEDVAIAEQVEKHEERLALARTEYSNYTAVVAAAEAEHLRAGASFECPHCARLSPLVSEERAAELSSSLPGMRQAASMLANAVDTRQRDLDAAIAARKAVAEGDAVVRKTTKAAEAARQKVAAWTVIAQMMSPDGIPSEILAPSLAKVNARLRESAAAFDGIGYGAVSVSAEGVVTRDGRPFGLLSEAEQWLACAMVTEALVHVSGAGLLILDRLDVLWPKYRSPAIDWLRGVVADGTQVIVFATLKQPAKLAGIRCLWLEGGRVMDSETGEVSS